MAESSGGGAASPARVKQLKTRKKVAPGKAGIPFKSGFRTARGQAQFKRRGGVNRALPGTVRGTTKAKKGGKKGGKKK